jgi:hypothetical protein
MANESKTDLIVYNHFKKHEDEIAIEKKLYSVIITVNFTHYFDY